MGTSSTSNGIFRCTSRNTAFAFSHSGHGSLCFVNRVTICRGLENSVAMFKRMTLGCLLGAFKRQTRLHFLNDRFLQRIMAAGVTESRTESITTQTAKLDIASNGGLTTEHLYYNDTELYECTAKVLAEGSAEFKGQTHPTLILDRTVMHPQGGGQPADKGSIRRGPVTFEVVHVQKQSRDSPYVEHVGSYEGQSGRLAVGDEVTVVVDANTRKFNARLHSAGHLLDSAFINLGWTDLEPSKGYHFPEGPYVEYIGNIPNDKREEVIKQLNEEVGRLVEKQMPVLVSRNGIGERMVNVGGTECPCGGTHVKNTSVIGGMQVTRIKKSKKVIRVSYEVTGS